MIQIKTNKISRLVFSLLFFAVSLVPFSLGSVSAAIPIECPDGYQTTVPDGASASGACDNHQTGGPAPDDTEGADGSGTAHAAPNDQCKDGDFTPDKDKCGIAYYIVVFTNALSALVGIAIVIMITVGGIQYSAARDNPQAVQAARTRIINALLALVVYLFMIGFLQWIVPGGVFN